MVKMNYHRFKTIFLSQKKGCENVRLTRIILKVCQDNPKTPQNKQKNILVANRFNENLKVNINRIIDILKV